MAEEKTIMTHIKDGFNFLGQDIRKYSDGGEANPYDHGWKVYSKLKLRSKIM